MVSIVRLEWWLSFVLLFALAGNSAAQSPQPPAEKPGRKVPSLLTLKPIKESPKDDELQKLLKARFNEAVEEIQGRYRLYQSAGAPYTAMAEVAPRLVQAGLELSDKPGDRVDLLTLYVGFAKEVELVAQARKEAAQATEFEVQGARYQRLDAEIQLLRAKQAADKAGGK